MKKKKRVVAALSGGVDSSVAAALLKEAGYDVIGISMQLYDHAQNETTRFDSCCSLKEVDVARRVAQILEIPYYVLNFEKAFQEKVVDYFVKEYLNARTPNPCVKCNSDVKFKALIQKAKELGADYLATGHYVKNVLNAKTGFYELHKAKDVSKDQSYFLFDIDRNELPYLLFPLGDLLKTHVRDLAKRFGLPTAHKPESMEICFIPNNDYAAFIEKKLSSPLSKVAGNVVSSDGKILKQHRGYYQYTVGQRKGIGLSQTHPLYVVEIDPNLKQVCVGKKADLWMRGLIAKDINWLRLPETQEVSLKIRHSKQEWQARFSETVSWSSHAQPIFFQDRVSAVTPGQAAVFYQDDVLLGGGWIERGLH